VAGAAARAAGAGEAPGAGGAGLEKDFEMLFGAEAAKVAATPDGRDDAAFAEKVLAVARTADKTPPLQAMLWEYRDRYHNSANYGICSENRPYAAGAASWSVTTKPNFWRRRTWYWRIRSGLIRSK